MKKIFKIASISLFVTSALMAQNAGDILRPSQSFNISTARVQAMSGAFGALGGDFGSISINPAGLGVYRTSEFFISPSITYNNTSSSYLGSSADDFKFNFNIGSWGLVSGNTSSQDEGLVSFNYAIGYNRLADYHKHSFISTPNAKGSMLDEFVTNANNGNWGDAYEELAYQTYLITENPSTGYKTKTNDFQYLGGNTYGQYLDREVDERGRMGEYVFALGANISHFLYLGGSVNIQDYINEKNTFHYEQTKHENFTGKYDPLIGNVYGRDTVVTEVDPYFENFTFKTYDYTRGTGVNVKIGAIIRPIDFLRIGLALHTPTTYWMSNEFNTSMTSNFYSGGYSFDQFVNPANGDTLFNYNVDKQYSARSDVYYNEYTVSTPLKAMASIGLQLADKGLIDVDYEYIDYSTARVRNSYGDYRFINDDIKNIYAQAHNLRIGAEYRYDFISFRGGYGYYGTPYAKAEYGKSIFQNYSGGIGFRNDNGMYLDLTYVLSTHNYTEYPYQGSEAADMTSNTSRFIATLGVKF